MGVEIERKFLVAGPFDLDAAEASELRQGYLCLDPERVVRVRLDGARGFLTVKGKARGPERAEFEYEISAADAGELLENLCLKPLIEKTRYRLRHEGDLWEIDVFGGENEGLVLAEIELEAADQTFTPPDWLGPEVTGDSRYANASLVRNPYRRWGPTTG